MSTIFLNLLPEQKLKYSIIYFSFPVIIDSQKVAKSSRWCLCTLHSALSMGCNLNNYSALPKPRN